MLCESVQMHGALVLLLLKTCDYMYDVECWKMLEDEKDSIY